MGSRAYTLQTDGEPEAAALEPQAEERPAACEPKYRRLTRTDVGRLVKMRDSGMTQAAIAQQLGCSQQAVSLWLADLTDTTAESKLYLRGQALTLARNIVKKGRAADHVAVLKGLNVLEEQAQSGVTVNIEGFNFFGIGQPQKPLSPPLPEVTSESIENP